MSKDIQEPNEYMVMMYSPKNSETDECVINAVTITVRVDPTKKPNYGLIEKKAKEYLKPMGVEFRASEIRAIGFFPRAGY